MSSLESISPSPLSMWGHCISIARLGRYGRVASSGVRACRVLPISANNGNRKLQRERERERVREQALDRERVSMRERESVRYRGRKGVSVRERERERETERNRETKSNCHHCHRQ